MFCGVHCSEWRGIGIHEREVRLIRGSREVLCGSIDRILVVGDDGVVFVEA